MKKTSFLKGSPGFLALCLSINIFQKIGYNAEKFLDEYLMLERFSDALNMFNKIDSTNCHVSFKWPIPFRENLYLRTAKNFKTV